MDLLLIPSIDDLVPLPSEATDITPVLSPTEELSMRVNTIKLIADLSNKSLKTTEQDIQEAHLLAKAMAEDPKLRPQYARYNNPTMAYLAGMIQQSSCQLIDELSEMKHYVINKLVHEVEYAESSKDRITALSRLGEIDGIDAFKKRSEMIIKLKPIEEVENELLKTLSNLEFKALENAQQHTHPVPESAVQPK